MRAHVCLHIAREVIYISKRKKKTRDKKDNEMTRLPAQAKSRLPLTIQQSVESSGKNIKDILFFVLCKFQNEGLFGKTKVSDFKT